MSPMSALIKEWMCHGDREHPLFHRLFFFFFFSCVCSASDTKLQPGKTGSFFIPVYLVWHLANGAREGFNRYISNGGASNSYMSFFILS